MNLVCDHDSPVQVVELKRSVKSSAKTRRRESEREGKRGRTSTTELTSWIFVETVSNPPMMMSYQPFLYSWRISLFSGPA